MMSIKRVKINGIENPVGFNFSHINLSYVIECGAEDLLSPELIIYTEKNLKKELYRQNLDIAESHCTQVNFKPKKETRYYFIIKCGKIQSDICYFETGTDFNCRFISPQTDITHPVVFKDFSSAGSVVSARLYVTGVGLYEAYINGKKVGREYLTPYCNDYDNALQYQTFDVTDYIKNSNKLEIALGDGWYKGRFGLKHKTNIYGNTYAAAAKLVLIDTIGDRTVIVTDESWQARRSHTTFSNIYDGEIIDDTIDVSENFAVKYCDKKFNVIERISLPVVCKKELKPELIISPKGEQILDFKQNISAIIRFNSRMKKGETTKLTVGEVLQEACFYRDNLRTAKAELVYTSDGKEKTVRPHFTYYGFRYVLVEGIDKVNPDDFTAEVIFSDIEDTVRISTDNAKINQLLSNCKWGQYSNFVDVPTDCPQRDERLGWTGDAEVFSRAACFQADCRAFYDKYLFDLRADQKLLGGNIPMYSPSAKEANTPACSVWADAATIVPWNVYQFYGDKTILKTHFNMISEYADTLIAADAEHGDNRLYNFGFHLGDWLSQDGASANALKGATDDYFIASMYYYNSIGIAAKAAATLNDTKLYEYYDNISKEIHSAILSEYFSPNGRLAIDTQTAYALCVNFGVWIDKEKLIDGFRNRLKKDGFTVKGGFVGATQLIQAAIAYGLIDEAFRILYSESYPSWLYCVNLGATTIWERWNAINADGSISSTGMNSLNHYSYGAVAEAFYGYIAGLRTVSPGFKQVEISPVFNYRLKNLEFAYASPSGDYVVNYSVENANKVLLHIEVPYGAEAGLTLKQCSAFGEKRLAAGKYDFEIKLTENLNNPFSLDTPLCEILAHPITAVAFKEVSPGFYYYFSTTETGLGGESLGYVARLDSFRIPDKKLAALDKKLREIKA